MPPKAQPSDLDIVKLLDDVTFRFMGEPVTLEVLVTTYPPEHHLYIGQRLIQLRSKGVVEITRESPVRYKLTGECNGCPDDIKNFIEMREDK